MSEHNPQTDDDRDLEPELRACPPAEWARIIRRARLGKPVKTVALALPWYADHDSGENVFPGEVRLAAVCELHVVTVRNALKRLRALGLVQRLEKGSSYGRGGGGKADRYRLTAPVNILAPSCPIELLPPDELPAPPERASRNQTGTPSRTLGDDVAAAGTASGTRGDTADKPAELVVENPDVGETASHRLGDQPGEPTESAVDNYPSPSPRLAVSGQNTESPVRNTESPVQNTEPWMQKHRAWDSPTFHGPPINHPSPLELVLSDHVTCEPEPAEPHEDTNAGESAEHLGAALTGVVLAPLGPTAPAEAAYAAAQKRLLELEDHQFWIEHAERLLRGESGRRAPDRQRVLVLAADLALAARPPTPARPAPQAPAAQAPSAEVVGGP